MQASLVARLPLVSRSHWQPTHGKQPILLKKGTLGRGPRTHSMPVKPKKKAARKQTQRQTQRRKLGQADQLPGSAWSLWLHHICGTGPSWLYPLVCLGHLLCLRVTEVLNLRPKDFNLEVGVVKVQALKRQKETDKVMGEAAVAFVRKLMDEWFSVRRMRNSGILGTREMLDAWHLPEELEHYLFPASRRGSHKVNRGKDVVSKAIRNARKTFRIPHIPDVNTQSNQESLRAPPLH